MSTPPSLYRLFLRAASAAALHKPIPTSHIRQLYRAYFEDKFSLTSLRWNKHADRTLSLLCNAAISRGTPHNLVANLAQLSMRHYNRNRLTEWTHIPTPPPSPKNDKDFCSAIDATAWDDLETVVRLAEGRNRVLLGRLRPHRPNRPIRRHLMYMRKWKLQ